MLVNEGFIKLLDLVCEIRPELDVSYGGIGGHIVRNTEHPVDAMKLIQVSVMVSPLPEIYFRFLLRILGLC